LDGFEAVLGHIVEDGRIDCLPVARHQTRNT
jgi:hypothetical protein